MTIDINKQPKRLKEEDVVSLYAKDITPRNFNSPQPEQPKAVNTNEEPMANGSEPNGLDLYKQDLTGSQDPNTVFMDEIQKAMSEKNYKSLLQSDIAAYNLKMNAQKYLDNSLATQGLGTQGYGTTAHVGIENQAQNLYAQNLENYNQQESDALLAAQERKKQEEQEAKTKAEAESRESDNQLVNYLQESDGSEEMVAKYMDNYGYAKDKDGKWYKKDSLGNPDLSRPASSYIQSMVDYIQKPQKTETLSANGYPVIENAPKEISFINGKEGRDLDGVGKYIVGLNKDKELSSEYANEFNKLKVLAQNGELDNSGTMIRLRRNNQPEAESQCLFYYQGKYYMVSYKDYVAWSKAGKNTKRLSDWNWNDPAKDPE